MFFVWTYENQISHKSFYENKNLWCKSMGFSHRLKGANVFISNYMDVFKIY
jgi:hypothetical protein